MRHLSVGEAAKALGTSSQTVLTLLREGRLRGQQRAWGSRGVWDVSREAVDEFLAAHGRLDGQRRPAMAGRPGGVAQAQAEVLRSERRTDSGASLDELLRPAPKAEPDDDEPGGDGPDSWVPDDERHDRRPFVLRPRGRATVVVVVLGVPLLVAWLAVRVTPGALWYDELHQLAVFRQVVLAKAELHVVASAVSALFLGVNAGIALWTTGVLRRTAGRVALVVVAAAAGNLFGSAADRHWELYLLWRHRQSFGTLDPLHQRDVGFFVFSLPLEIEVAALVFWLLLVTAGVVVLAHAATGSLRLRPRRITYGALTHLAALAALLLVVVSWRLRLQEYLLELAQPSADDSQAFSGAGYVDANVRGPVLTTLSVIAVGLAAACVLLPFVAGSGLPRSLGRPFAGIAMLGAAGLTLAATLAPSLAQRYLVDPNPLLSEAPYLARSITATRAALGLDRILVEPSSPAGRFQATDLPFLRKRLANVATWDDWVLGARMRQLVSDPPYYRPGEPVLDVVSDHGHRKATAVSARELDLTEVPTEGDTWVNDRLSYTHGLGLVRFSTTDTAPGREPRLLDRSVGLREPRLYFGNLPADDDDDPVGQDRLTPRLEQDLADASWVLADTRRAEVDVPVSGETDSPAYHYDGTAGIRLSSWVRRLVFALSLESNDLFLSDDITSDTRLLLHRDVHERLRTLAPFIQWDSGAAPLTADGRVVFVVDGYTTSDMYPYAERVALGQTTVSYARASVVATVDGFSGRVSVYVTDEDDPIVRAWSEIFPSLLRPASEMPEELRPRLRYSSDLFDAQATAYERLHTTRPEVVASDADVWTRPIALSGPLEVAGDVDFDESDEDDLRLTLEPGYFYGPPPGHTAPRLVVSTYYAPHRGQNLVGSLSGWIDRNGRARLTARRLPRDPITLGPAQVSRLVFATARVRNLLGLRNLEIRDVDQASLDSVLLGRPRIIVLPQGVIQIQSLYEGSRGPGAARLLGVTAFVNGRAGLGPDIDSAVRQALNEPPGVAVRPPRDAVTVDEPARITFRVENARREVVAIDSGGRTTRTRADVTDGPGTVVWKPDAAGEVRVRVHVTGLDGTTVSDRTRFRVLQRPPTLRLPGRQRQAEVGKELRVPFSVTHAVQVRAEVSTRAGVVFTRRFEVRRGPGVVAWLPDAAGPAELVVRVRGHQAQQVTKRLLIDVTAPPRIVSPTLTLGRIPGRPTVGRRSSFSFTADGCRTALAEITGPEEQVQTWRFPCPAAPARFAFTPTVPGRYLLTAVARGDDVDTQASVEMRVRERQR